MDETYLEAGRRGKNTWLRYLLGVGLNFKGSALNMPSLFHTDRFVPAYSLIQFLVVAALFYLAVFVIIKRRRKKGG